MSDVTQVEVEPQKTAFISRPYSREEKLKQEEEELQELIEGQKQDASSEEVEEPEPASSGTFTLVLLLLVEVLGTYLGTSVLITIDGAVNTLEFSV